MSDEDRKDRSVLAGMSRKEANALVALAAHGNSSLWTGEAGPGGEDLDAPSLERLLALAALGARCVGATEFKSSEGESLLVHLVGRDGKARDTFAYLPTRRVLVLEGE